MSADREEHRTASQEVTTIRKQGGRRRLVQRHWGLIPASGVYEWDKKASNRQSYFIQRADRQPMGFAGLWERWQDPAGGEGVESCTILTTKASAPVAAIYDRMPVILEPEDFDLWLDPQEQGIDRLRGLLHSVSTSVLAMYAVSRYVNHADNEGGARCIAPRHGGADA